MKTETIENIAEITVQENNILVMTMLPKSDIGIEEAKKITETASKLVGDVVHSNLVDIRQMTFMSGEARKFFGSQDKSSVKAVGILSNSSFHRPLVNLYLKISRPSLPTKTFDDKDKAEEWLLESLK